MSGEKKKEKGRGVREEKNVEETDGREQTEWETEKVERRERNGQEREGIRK